IRSYYAEQAESWPHAALRMVYTDNHDQNSWDDVASEIYGPAYEAAIALSFVGSGLPLIYNGQEADLDRKLAFFEKDPISWKQGRYDALLRQLIALKTEARALHNGRFGASMVEVPTNAAADVYAFTRGTADERVFAVFNLSPRAQQVSFEKARHHGRYTDAVSGADASFGGSETLDLAPWGYRIFKESK
ncbi:MAG: alpha amylase C-terminal domain-containing protein, partial [Erythrobacter sp.]|nr:alpha amylase C-terminal domain-containing protein [Erythrobacter sp.]